MPERFDPPGECPVCGGEVPSAARACPGCGACHGSGWSEKAAYDALGLPDEEFDHRAFVEEEFERPRGGPPRPWWMILTAAGLILLLLIWVLA